MHEITLEELKEKLADQLDEVTLIELPGVNTYDIVEAFHELIEEKMDKLVKEVE